MKISLPLQTPLGVRQSVSLLKGITDSFALCVQNDKLVNSCECHGVCSKLSLCHCEGAGVRWTPLQSRSTDRAGRRDTKRLWQSVSPLRVLRILSRYALRMTSWLVPANVTGCAVNCRSVIAKVRVSGGHLCKAEAPTEPAGETQNGCGNPSLP